MSSLFFENKNLTINYDKDQAYLLLIWKGFIPSTEFRALACEIIKAVENTKVQKILSDNTEWKIISPNDYSWAASHWFPKAEQSGVTHMATVLSKDTFNRLAERTVQNMAEVNNMRIQNFEHIKEAVDWLNTASVLRSQSSLVK